MMVASRKCSTRCSRRIETPATCSRGCARIRDSVRDRVRRRPAAPVRIDMQLRHIAVALALAACSAPSRPLPTTPAPPHAALDDDAGGDIAPDATAGLYWLPYQTCSRCAK